MHFVKCYLGLLLTFVFNVGFAQEKQQISADLNRSFHGTGDLPGVGFAFEYGRWIAKKLELTAGIGAQVHHDVYPLTLQMGGRTIDASYRMVTGGILVFGLAYFAPLHTRRHEGKLGLGPLVRYQSSSASGDYGVTFPPAVDYPEPVFTFRQIQEQNIVSLGYVVSASYAYTFKSGLLLGAKASFQNDTNGDVLAHYGLR